MNTQSYGVNFLFMAPQTGKDIKKSYLPGENTDSSFKNFLDGSMNKSIKGGSSPDERDYRRSDAIGYNKVRKASSTYSGRSEENDNSTAQVKDDVRFKRFSEINKGNKTDTGKTSGESSDVNGEKAAGNNAPETKTKEDIAVESLASVLGLKPEEMTKLLDALKIKPEELTDETKLDSVVNKLANLMNLSDQQKLTLSAVIKEIKAAVDGVAGSAKNDKNTLQSPQGGETAKPEAGAVKSGSDTVKVANENISVISGDGKEKGFSEIISDMRQKLDELTKQLQQNPRKLLAELSEKVGAIAENAGDTKVEEVQETKGSAEPVTKGQKTDDSNEDSKQVKEPVEKNDGVEEARPEEETGKEGMKGNSESGPKTSDARLKTPDDLKQDSRNEIQFNNLMQDQTQKNSEVKEAARVYKEVPVQKGDIINQVVEKAKVVLTGDKSEMVMDLKPDSLGKISMKIITERGIVVARFVAESQQVKEVLESNMQLLKDSLEKQGMSVQGFSVSVDQNPYNGSGTSQYSNDSGKAGTSNSSYMNRSVGQTVKVADTFESAKVANPYAWNESKINLTA